MVALGFFQKSNPKAFVICYCITGNNNNNFERMNERFHYCNILLLHHFYKYKVIVGPVQFVIIIQNTIFDEMTSKMFHGIIDLYRLIRPSHLTVASYCHWFPVSSSDSGPKSFPRLVPQSWPGVTAVLGRGYPSLDFWEWYFSCGQGSIAVLSQVLIGVPKAKDTL